MLICNDKEIQGRLSQSKNNKILSLIYLSLNKF